MRGPGMWMPKRNYGAHWTVEFSITRDDAVASNSKNFRTRQSARDFIDYATRLFNKDERITAFSFNLKKI